VDQQDDADVAGPETFAGQIPGQDYDPVFSEQLAHRSWFVSEVSSPLKQLLFNSRRREPPLSAGSSTLLGNR
jgi:hypothetical protein